jgi:hypothetical protein
MLYYKLDWAEGRSTVCVCSELLRGEEKQRNEVLGGWPP